MVLAISKSSDELVSRLCVWNHRNDAIKENSLCPLQCSALPYIFQDWELEFSDIQTDRFSYTIDFWEHGFVLWNIMESFYR